MTLLNLIVSDLDEKTKAKRADQWLASQEGLPSRSQLKDWFAAGRIKRRGLAIDAKTKVFIGDEIEIDVPAPKTYALEPRPYPLEIHYEDEHLIVLYKPRGLSMHPGAGKDDEMTLVHALLAHSGKLSDSGGEFRPGIVHRLDKDTEGLVVVAKNNKVHEELSRQFSERSIQRAYWTLCLGNFPNRLEVDAPIGRHPVHRKKMAIHPKGRESRTLFEKIAGFEAYSWLRCKLYSGRTHQIRVHLSSHRFPVVNDPLYGGAWERKLAHLSEAKKLCLRELKGQALMAYELGFVHPITKKELHFLAKMPSWLECLTKK